jgi:hypothetical protein
MPRLKGCNPSPRRLLARANNMAKYVMALPPPPVEFDATKGFDAFRMFGNDQYGDCTEAENGNAICGLTAASRGLPIYISDQTIEKTYFAQTGGSDSGLDIGSNLDYENVHGLRDSCGGIHKPGPHGSIDATNLAEFAVACYYFGRLKLGIATPPMFMNSNDGDVVDWPIGRNPGGMDHCVLVCGRKIMNGSPHWKLITWGGVRWVNDGFIVECCGNVGEAWAVYNCPDRLKPDGRTIEGFREQDLLDDWEVFNGRTPKPRPAPSPDPDGLPRVAAEIARRAIALGPDDERVQTWVGWSLGWLPK